MEENNNNLICDLAEEYADSMCSGDNEVKFSRGSIVAAYIIGAETALQRFRNTILAVERMGGLDSRQAHKLIMTINEIESMHKNHG